LAEQPLQGEQIASCLGIPHRATERDPLIFS
jgi:hypothetical protein